MLNAYVVESLGQVREISEEWLQGYKAEWLHNALAGKLTPGLMPVKKWA